ncbi:putative rna polymerase ii-associated protein 3 [Lyophyllum shimeji]|uniref:RNA polymerase II-associated protein 3 n=1 Tax=Lyophyllum shimeji TaxID=47721 RepID=A0A9P3Q1A8_LYOSH|nr:putative rna polymerase ii-associated protein 3 [Lyophyllum shimeji]
MASRKAQIEKEKGNAAFKSGDYPTAIGHYTAAILADNKDYTLPLNRAAAYLKLGKNEDAERDCTAVLNLNAMNAKALFRRGQARVGMGKLDEALSDLSQALKREPANDAIKQELKKVTDLTAKQGAKRQKPIPSTQVPNRRRVPITIIDPNKPAISPTPPGKAEPAAKQATLSTPKPAPKAAPEQGPSSTETMKPVSTRSLKTVEAHTAQPTPSTARAPSPKPEQPRTFKDAKQARESAKPSRVGGGIFRANGESTVFPPRGDPSAPSPKVEQVMPATPPPPSATAPSPMNVDQEPVGAVVEPVPPEQAPTTLFEFASAWRAASSTSERWGLMLSVPPPRIPALFKTSLEPQLLISILQVFREVLRRSPNAAVTVREYLDAFARVERFGTIVLFLSREEKAVARDVWEALGVTKEDVPENSMADCRTRRDQMGSYRSIDSKERPIRWSVKDCFADQKS